MGFLKILLAMMAAKSEFVRFWALMIGLSVIFFASLVIKLIQAIIMHFLHAIF